MKRRPSRPMRLPNGFGSIVKLSGTRRRPYMARTATKTYNDKGQPVFDILGYFTTWSDAYNCLVDYNNNPYDIDIKKITFEELFELFINRRIKAGIGKANLGSLRSAFRRCPGLFRRRMQELKTLELQAVLDDLATEYKHASLELNKSLWVQMFEMAIELDICNKNYAKFININKQNDDEHGIPFTRAEIERMWECVDDVPNVDMLLVLIYSGFRVAAYRNLKIDIENKTFTGGVKTAAAKDRTIPIHSRILPLVSRLMADKRLFGQSPYEIRSIVKPTLTACGIPAINHTPHDCRHTLATELNDAKVADGAIKRILGHSIQDITQGTYIHASIDLLREEIEKMK